MPNGYWSEAKCREIAKECKSIEEFRLAYDGRAHSHAKKLGITKIIAREMYDDGYWPIPDKKPNGYWTLEKCKEICKNYDSQTDLMRDHRDVYAAVKEHGWQKDCFSPMKGRKRPNGYWTLEKCKEEASKYDSPVEMRRESYNAFTAMRSHGWYDECCAEMKSRRVPNNFWNEERIMEVILTTNSRTEFQSNYPGAYGAAIAQGVYERLTEMMVEQELWKAKNTKRSKKTKPDTKWSDEMAINRASNYKSLYEFRTKDSTAYHALVVRGLLEIACSHMERKHMPEGYWTKERVMEKVSVSDSLKDFKNRFRAAYMAAQIRGWLVDVVEALGHEREQWTEEKAREVIATCKDYNDFRIRFRGCWNYLCDRNLLVKLTKNLERKGSLCRRRIYVFEFKDNHAYIGLAKDPEDRYNEHTRYDQSSAVYQYLQKTHCKFDFKLLTGWLDKDEASMEEENWRQEYIKDGWLMLNRVKCGSLGGWQGKRKYSFEYCQQIGAGYKTRNEFNKANPSLYAYASRTYGIEKVCPHMPKDAKVKWSVEKIEHEISKYGTMPEIKKADPSLFSRIDNLRLVDKYFILINGIRVVREEYMSAKVRQRFIRNYGSILNYKKHTLTECQEVAKRYKTRGEFKKKDNGWYTYSRQNYDMDEVCKHMPVNVSCLWNEENAKAEIGRYEKMGQIRIQNPSLYSYIMTNHLQSKYFEKVQPEKGKAYYVVKTQYRKI